ncbi:MAG: rRNA maturation RNase YbeY [Bacteroidota bacterium]|nr:rRNA maturation RNase YbeY [Bacteroidota bacterium]
MITVFNNYKKQKIDKSKIVSLVKFVLKGEKSLQKNINIVFVDDEYITQLNKQYLYHNWTTDVISFPLNDDKKIEGEIYINIDQTRRQAKEYKVKISEELNRLLIHGTLHLIGYTDTTQRTKKKMSLLEDMYLGKCKNIYKLE